MECPNPVAKCAAAPRLKAKIATEVILFSLSDLQVASLVAQPNPQGAGNAVGHRDQHTGPIVIWEEGHWFIQTPNLVFNVVVVDLQGLLKDKDLK